MNPTHLLDRRTFLADLGHGAVALVIVGIAGCGPKAIASSLPSPIGSSPGPSPSRGPVGGASTPGAASGPPGSGMAGPTWARVHLGFVSAYVLVRDGEATLVDTGEAGSEDDIEATLTSIGLTWASVGSVIITHSHGDHAGSRIAVLERASGATGYAGAEDIRSMGGVDLTAVADGERVSDMRIVTTPGHTAGSISVYDEAAGVLVAGDALKTAEGRPIPPGAPFTADMDEAMRSIVKLGELSFETLLVGHGEPIEAGASALVAELGASA